MAPVRREVLCDVCRSASAVAGKPGEGMWCGECAARQERMVMMTDDELSKVRQRVASRFDGLPPKDDQGRFTAEFKAALVEAIETSGLPQGEVGRIAGVPQGTVSRIFRAARAQVAGEPDDQGDVVAGDGVSSEVDGRGEVGTPPEVEELAPEHQFEALVNVWRGRALQAEANYQFMVARAADEKLDGYRELGDRALQAEIRGEQLEREAEALRLPGALHDRACDALGLYSSARSEATPGDLVLALLTFVEAARPSPPRCRVCGCTNARACPEGWVEDDLCSTWTQRSSS